MVLSGFSDIEIIDLDTIDVSNLNRQFLFRKKDVGKAKSLIAKESVLRFNPSSGIRIKSHLGNIMDRVLFNADYVSGFSCVANALDNISARKHVNRVCVAAQVPLLEAGSTGYEGQTNVHLSHVCECYECLPKATPKKHPICTIRSTPSKPVHCIEWAKHLYCLLFGDTEQSMLAGGSGADEDAASVAAESNKSGAGAPSDQDENEKKTVNEEGADAASSNGSESTDSGYAARDSLIKLSYVRPDCGDAAAMDDASIRSYAERIFVAWFEAEIQNKMTKNVYKTATHTPTPISLSDIREDVASLGAAEKLMGGGGSALHNTVWTVAESTAVFFECIVQTYANQDYRSNIGLLSFDKDDRLALDFVTAASNLRSHVFGIPMQSPFSVKQIAGNIVHAIATTNAIIAGLETLELMKVCADPNNHLIVEKKRLAMNSQQGMSKEEVSARVAAMKEESNKYLLEKCKATFIYMTPNRRGMVLGGGKLCPPNLSCSACHHATAIVTMDTNKVSLKTFVDLILKDKLGFEEPEFTCGADAEKIFDYPDDFYDAPEGEEAMGSVVVSKLPGSGGIYPGAVILIREEDRQEVELNVVIRHKDGSDFDVSRFPDLLAVEFADEERQRRSTNAKRTLEQKAKEAAEKSRATENLDDDDDDDDDDDFMIISDSEVEEKSTSGDGRSRKRSVIGEVEGAAPALKRARTPER